MILFKSPEADVIPVLESIICPLNPPLVHMLDVVSVKEGRGGQSFPVHM